MLTSSSFPGETTFLGEGCLDPAGEELAEFAFAVNKDGGTLLAQDGDCCSFGFTSSTGCVSAMPSKAASFSGNKISQTMTNISELFIRCG